LFLTQDHDTSTLVMETEEVSEKFVFNSALRGLIAREDFIHQRTGGRRLTGHKNRLTMDPFSSRTLTFTS
jgi:hypothetical protein